MRIGIAGAGAIGRSVATELLAYGHKILLIEQNVRHYEPETVPARTGCWPTHAAASLEDVRVADVRRR